MIKIDNLAYGYDNIPIVSNLNLNIEKGDYVAIVGKNGAGKTTFMKLILSLTFKTNGEIELFDGKKISVLTHHGFPYRRFNSTPEDNKPVFEFFDNIIAKYNPDVITGDFNAEDFMSLMEETASKYKRTINDITTVDNKKFDDILVHQDVDVKTKIIKLLSDHFIIIDDVEL